MKTKINDHGVITTDDNLSSALDIEVDTTFSKAFNVSVKTVTANFSASNEQIILASTSDGAIQVELPNAKANPGRIFTIKKIDDTANNITITSPSSQLIDGSTKATIGTAWASYDLIASGSAWYIV